MLDEDTLSTIRESGAARLVVGFSGGIDSHALLHALVACNVPIPVHALHINHAISPYADAWQAHCATVCGELQVGYTAICVSVEPGAGVEERARDARYEAFVSFLEPDDLLLLGHHADDQVETALLALFRGSNKPGLAGMPRQRTIGRARLFRPLLDIGRAQIESYAIANDLGWIVDGSNEDVGMNRNYVRHRLLPVIKARWPDFASTLLKSLERDADTRQLVDTIGKMDFSANVSSGGGLAVSGLRFLDGMRRKNAVRCWIESFGLPIPGDAVLSGELDAVLDARDDAAPLLTWQGICLRRHNDELFLTTSLPPFDVEDALSLASGNVVDTGAGVLTAETVKGRGLAVDDLADVSIRFRRGGERIRIGRNRTLKNIFQEAGVPVWLRDCLPLVFLGDELVAIAGLPQWNVAPIVASANRSSADESGIEFLFEVPGHPYTR